MATATVTTTPVSKHSAYQVCPPAIFKPLRTSPTKQIKNTNNKNTTPFKSNFLPLHSVFPKSFDDMYTPDVLENKALLARDGRPSFTHRELADWTKNDIRSLLIVDSLRPEWNGQVPQIIEPGYRVQVLPFDATDEQLIAGLVGSDIYKEMKFEPEFLVQTAQYTVEAARQRRAATNSTQTKLTKPEWRNIIENYLLNLGCEAQCRLDFKKSCSYLKRHKLYQQQQNHHPRQPTSTPATKKSTSPLLKKAILTSLSTSPDFPSQQSVPAPAKVSLSRAEKQQIWVQVQTELYARLGLNWEADELV